MKVLQYIIIIGLLFLFPVSSKAVDQQTIDHILFILDQPSGTDWSEIGYDDQTLIDAFEELYQTGALTEDDYLCENVLAAMGNTGFVEFEPTITGAFEDYPIMSLSAIGNIPTETAIAFIISILYDEIPDFRERAAMCLLSIDFYMLFPESTWDAYNALQECLAVETEDWVIETMAKAILVIQPQLPPNNPPICSFVPVYSVDPGVVTFDATGCWDPEGDPLEYTWDFNNDGIPDLDYSGPPDNPTYIYIEDYNDLVILTLDDGHGNETTCVAEVIVDLPE